MGTLEIKRSYQWNRYGCGAECVKSVLHYYDVSFNGSLYSELGTTRRYGTDEKQIQKFLQRKGLGAECQKGATKSTLKSIIRKGWPGILYLEKEDHWVVASGFDDVYLHVMDPVWFAKRKWGWDDLKKSWGGFVIIVRPR